MLCSCGGEICTALKPAGPNTVSHSFAMSVHFHSNRWTDTSPAAAWPLARYVGSTDGRLPVGGESGGGFRTPSAQCDVPNASTPAATARRAIAPARLHVLAS